MEARLGQISLATSGFARGASLEHERIGADREALEAIARAGGGALDPEHPSEVPLSMPRREPLAGWLLALAAVLVPVEVAARRVFN